MAQAINNWQLDQKADLNAPQSKPKYISTFRALSGYMKEHRLTFAGFIGCTLIAISAELLQPYLMKIAIDDNLMVGKNDYRSLMFICGIYFSLSLLSMMFTYLQNNLLQKRAEHCSKHSQTAVCPYLQAVDVVFRQGAERQLDYACIQRYRSDQPVFNQVLLSLFRDGFTLIFILVMMFQLDVTLTLYCLILLPIIAGIAIAFRRYMRHTYQMARTRLSRLVAFVAENLSGMNLIQVFHQQKEQEKQFEERNDSYFKANIREIRTNVLFNRSYEILNNLAIAFVTWLGGQAVLGTTLEFGVLYAFITYIRLFFQPINTITQQWNTLQSATVAINRIWSLLAIQPEVTDRRMPEAMEKSKVQGRVDFDRVTFGYEGGAPVIQDLDLHIKPGEMIGIVGTTGAGKSSLISLLCRFTT